MVRKENVRHGDGEYAVFTITNKQGGSVAVSSLGARVVSLVVPDKEGRFADIAVPRAESDADERRLWEGRVVAENSVEFAWRGDEKSGSVVICYVWTNDNTLELYIDASEGAFSLAADATLLILNLDPGITEDEAPEPHLYINGTRQSGSDDVWRINDWEKGVMNEAAVIASAISGRQVNAYTTLPLVRVAKRAATVSIECLGFDACRQLFFLEFSYNT